MRDMQILRSWLLTIAVGCYRGAWIICWHRRGNPTRSCSKQRKLDGTVEMLEQRNIPFITQENLGSAGGWYRGIQHALDHRFDAVWLMDDDGFPDAGALRLLEVALSPVSRALRPWWCEDAPISFCVSATSAGCIRYAHHLGSSTQISLYE